MTRTRLIRILIERALFNLIIALVVAFFMYFPIMLALGALHSEWSVVPALGWWSTYVINAAWVLVLDSIKGSFSDSKTAEKDS